MDEMPQRKKSRAHSLSTVKVLAQFAKQPEASLYGLQIAKNTGIDAGTLYPILGRLEQRGLLEGEWETIDPKEKGRGARRYFSLTKKGHSEADRAITKFKEDVRTIL